jgi:hypothetical protein
MYTTYTRQVIGLLWAITGEGESRGPLVDIHRYDNRNEPSNKSIIDRAF